MIVDVTILFGNTMNLRQLILASAVASTITSIANAEVSLQIGGSVDGQVGFINQDFDGLNGTATGEKRRKEAIVHDTTLTFEAFSHIESLGGLNVGGKIVLEADTSNSKYHMPKVSFGELNNFHYDSYSVSDSTVNVNRNAREVMLSLGGDFGSFEIGNTYGATKKMQIDAGTVAAGNGGVHGDAHLWVNLGPLFGNMSTPDFYTNRMAFYHLDDVFLPVNNANAFSTELATAAKVSYYTPNLNGFQAGLTFIPDTDVFGTVSNISAIGRDSTKNGFAFENVFEGGFMYDGNINDFGFQFSLLGQTGKAKSVTGDLFVADRLSTGTTKVEDLKAYEVGFATEFMGVGIAASYGHHNGLLSTMGANKYYTVGAGYEMGAWGLSVNYMESRQNSDSFTNALNVATRKKAEFNNLVFDVAYDCQGFMPYVSVSSFEAIKPLRGSDARVKDNGTVILAGMRFNF